MYKRQSQCCSGLSQNKPLWSKPKQASLVKAKTSLSVQSQSFMAGSKFPSKGFLGQLPMVGSSKLLIWQTKVAEVPMFGSRPAKEGSRPATGGSKPATVASTPTRGGSRSATGGLRSATGAPRPATGGSRPATGAPRPSYKGLKTSRKSLSSILGCKPLVSA